MPRKILTISLILVLLIGLFPWRIALAQTSQTPDLFESPLMFFGARPQTPPSRGQRNLANCMLGLMQFYYIAARFSDIPSHIRLRWPPYFRDFFLLPAQYADVMNVEQQLNRTRSSVMAAAFRCDVQQQRATERAYYKLEAELYYVRYFVDATPIPTIHPGWSVVNALSAAGAAVRIPRVTDNPQRRQNFLSEMLDAFGAIPGLSEDQRRSLLTGYFEEFEAKYMERVNSYAGGDAAWQELARKVDELIDTIKSLKNLGKELADVGREAAAAGQGIGRMAVNAAREARSAARKLKNSPGKAILEGAKEILNVAKVCYRAECKGAGDTVQDIIGSIMEVGSTVRSFSDRKTFEDVRVAIERQKTQQVEFVEEADLRARYEMLYGQINGAGISEMIEKMDELIKILSVGSGTEIAGSFQPLQKVQQCVRMTRTRQCS